MKDLELNWLSGIFLGWSLASFALMMGFFWIPLVRYVAAGSFGAGILALLIWSIVQQLQPKSVVNDAVDKILNPKVEK